MDILNELIETNTMVHYYEPLLRKKTPKTYYISVIIPVMGRISFLEPLVKTLKAAIKKCNKKINITIIEHSEEQLFKNKSKELNIDYFWIKKTAEEPFNKSLCHNIGSMLNKCSKNFLFHDLDCLVFDDFFIKLINELELGTTAIQPFKNRRLLYLPEDITENIVNGIININDIDINHESITIGDIGAPGGSICINKELFIKIGGYDPELFYGYSPEDMFFWCKMEVYSKIVSINNEILHMSHERLNETNEKIIEMIQYVNVFNCFSDEAKNEFLKNKKDIIMKNF